MHRRDRPVEAARVGGGRRGCVMLLGEEDVGGGSEVVDAKVVPGRSLQVGARAETALQ